MIGENTRINVQLPGQGSIKRVFKHVRKQVLHQKITDSKDTLVEGRECVYLRKKIIVKLTTELRIEQTCLS